MAIPNNTTDQFFDQYVDPRKKGELHWPYTRAANITPNDSTDLTFITRGIYIGVTGNLTVEMLESGTVTFNSVPAGIILPIRVRRVRATGTDATNLLALD